MEELKTLFYEMGEKPIAFHRIYAKITSSITAGLLLSQMIYWDKCKQGGEFYKTDEEWCDELGMGPYEFKSAKEKLKQLGLINYKRKGIPAKTFYTIKIEAIISLITSYGKNQQLVMGKTHNLCEEKPITITENTTENTTEKNIYEFQKNIPTAQDKKKSVVVKYNYTPEFEEIWSAFPEARSGNKKEAYDEYVNNWTEEELKEQIKILKRQIRVGLQQQQYLPAMQRRLKNLPKTSTEKREEKLDQIGFVLMEGLHETGDKTLTKAFGLDFTNEYVNAMGKRRYKIRHEKTMKSFK